MLQSDTLIWKSLYHADHIGNETIYTADVVKRLEEIVEQAGKMMQEIAIIDYGKAA